MSPRTYVQTMINGGYQRRRASTSSTRPKRPWSIQNAPGGSLLEIAEGAMITLIKEVANYAHSKDPNFQIWINSSGAYDMLANSTLVNTISGAIERIPVLPEPDDGATGGAAPARWRDTSRT